ncbi:hypothetical protein [Rhodococcus sp. WS3]|nr:hypothetical protein [Rhodococcus sp. WS3]
MPIGNIAAEFVALVLGDVEQNDTNAQTVSPPKEVAAGTVQSG